MQNIFKFKFTIWFWDISISWEGVLVVERAWVRIFILIATEWYLSNINNNKNDCCTKQTNRYKMQFSKLLQKNGWNHNNSDYNCISSPPCTIIVFTILPKYWFHYVYSNVAKNVQEYDHKEEARNQNAKA